MNNAAYNATIFQPRHLGEEFPHPPNANFWQPGTPGPTKKGVRHVHPENLA